MTHLVIDDVSKSFGSTIAVQNLSLEIAEGEVVALLGASGCGKTTLLRMIAGFIQPDQGVISFEGRPLKGVPAAARGFGFVFQSYALFPTKTVFDNIAFGLRVQGWTRQACRERVAELVDLVELQGLSRRYPHELSGGQQQRVAIARALAPKPGLLLLDEPLAALDARIREHLRDELRRIVDHLGVTTIYVTHDQNEALQLADRVALMHEGNILQLGVPEHIYQRPGSRFAADFVGSTSLVIGVIDQDGDLRPALGEPDVATFAVRPEHVQIRAMSDGADRKACATIERQSFTGPVYRLTLRLDDGQALTADVDAAKWIETGLAAGDAVAVTIDSRLAVPLEIEQQSARG